MKEEHHFRRNRSIVGVTALLCLAAIVSAAIYSNDMRNRFAEANRELREQAAEHSGLEREAIDLIEAPATIFHTMTSRFLQTVVVSSQIIFFLTLFSFPIRKTNHD